MLQVLATSSIRPQASRWAFAAAAMALATAGCGAFAPSALSGPFASREEKNIRKLAEHDSFPSPADVGLTKPTATP